MTFHKIKVDALIFDGKASDPPTGTEGEIIYHTGEECNRIYINGEWRPM